MIRKTVFALILICTAFAAAPVLGQGNKFVVDKVVANVGNSIVLYSEMEDISKRLLQERRERGYTSDKDPMVEALEYLLMQKLLYNQALIDSVEINVEYINEAVEHEVDVMLQERGSVAALEAYYHKPIFEIKDQLNQQYREMSYARNMRSEIQERVVITPGEVERYFRSLPKDSLPIVPEQYVYAHIIRYPASTKEAKQRVRERLLEMRERILNGTRFDMLARMYSEDPGTAVRGGEMDLAPKESFVAPFANALERLSPGQISEAVETEFGYHIIELLDKQGNLYHFRHILLRPQFTSQELAQTDRFLDSIAHKIRVDSLSFEKAAYEFSDDKYSKMNGGIVSNQELLEIHQMFDASMTSTKFFKEDLPPDVFRILSTMKPGDISFSFQSMDFRGNVLSKVLKLVEIIPAHPANLNEDYLRIEELALEDKQDREFQKWVDQKIESMYIRIDPEWRNSDFDNKAWIK